MKQIYFHFQNDMKVTCDALICDLEADGLTAWIEVDQETLVARHLSEIYQVL
jgi:hypothetical protein